MDLEDKISLGIWAFGIGLVILTACQSHQPDVLDDLGQAVLKKNESLEIDIKPHKPDEK